MTQSNQRNPHPKLSKINLDHPITFKFNDKTYRGYQGDTLASALLANGVYIQARSFKYGRFRGIFGSGVEEPNALIKLIANGEGSEKSSIIPNIKATEVELYQGLIAHSASANPSLNFDFRALLKPIHRFMPVGFYYKTFMWPQKLGHFYETILRNLAGFSNAPTEIDPDHYTHQYHQCDLLVVGGGISGLSAAHFAAIKGKKVYLVDERNKLGGNSYQNGADLKAIEQLNDLLKKIKNQANIKVFTRSTAFAYHDHNLMLVLENHNDHLELTERERNSFRQRVHKIRADKVLLAAGSHERGLMFSNNDLPKIMLATSLLCYQHQYGVCPGEKIVICGNNDSIYQVAIDLNDALLKSEKAKFQLICVDSRQKVNADLISQLEKNAIEYLIGYHPSRAIGNFRNQQIKAIELSTPRGKTIKLETDLVGISGGFNPVCHLDCHSSAKKPIFSNTHQAFLPATHFEQNSLKSVAGSLNGFNSFSACYQDGINQVIDLFAFNEKKKAVKDSSLKTARFHIPSGKKGLDRSAFVDYQNDVKVSDIKLAIKESYHSIEHVKRYSALGFGTDQGKTSNVNGIAVCANELKLPMDQVGTTTFRPSYNPVALGALSGIEKNETFHPQRYTLIEGAHQKQKPVYELVGQWYRPQYFPKNDETLESSVHRECLAARNSLAMMDASTLGKIDIQGKDAREFINRIYTNQLVNLKPNSCRYVLMLNENGMISDDGVIACISENHFVATTTTGGAQAVLSSMESWLQTEWSDLDVWLNSVTDHFATIALVGPKSRQFIENFSDDIDFSKQSFKFMQFRTGTISGIPVRVMRISFSGELAFEINVQSNYALYLWNLFLEFGHKEDFNLTLYGTETMHYLRAEKGYLIIGQDTDGSVSPYDANMGWAIGKNKKFGFIGDRSLLRSDLTRENRKHLVGLLSLDGQSKLKEGAQLVESASDNKMIGHVSSSYFSPILNQPIALALVKNGQKRTGEKIYAKTAKEDLIEVEITSAIFYDKENKKLDGI